jgi:transcriptional regulator with XRE-family HTH domain
MAGIGVVGEHQSGVSTPDQTPEHPLKTARLASDLTRQQVSSATGIGMTTLWQIESGRTQPRRATQHLLAAFFDLPREILFAPEGTVDG